MDFSQHLPCRLAVQLDGFRRGVQQERVELAVTFLVGTLSVQGNDRGVLIAAGHLKLKLLLADADIQ